jgi:hypothetical protein
LNFKITDKVMPPLFCENLKPLGGGWDSFFLIVDN